MPLRGQIIPQHEAVLSVVFHEDEAAGRIAAVVVVDRVQRLAQGYPGPHVSALVGHLAQGYVFPAVGHVKHTLGIGLDVGEIMWSST